MSKVLITQSNYIPWKGYFDAINLADIFIIFDEMQYTKRDWRNRNKIKTPNGTTWLSIPVQVKGKYFQKINETRVIDHSWREKHFKNIVQFYNKSDYFDNYIGAIEKLYLGSREELLTEINIKFITWVNSILGIETKVFRSSNFELAEGKTERLVKLCEEFDATEYITGPAARQYMDESLFNISNIKIKYLDYNGYPEYNQLYDGFNHDVTILDLIFNTGPCFSQYMKSFKNE